MEEPQKKAKEEERVQRLAEMVQADAEKKKKAEASAAQCKQLELLLQHKVTVQIMWEEDAWRTLEAGGEGSQSVISGYGKGKVPEKHICTNCLRKGIKCKWDEGG